MTLGLEHQAATVDSTGQEIKNIFRNFMQLVVASEEAHAKGANLLNSFMQELELFRRPPLDKASPLVAAIFAAMPTARLRTYMEAGCRHSMAASQNAARLDALFRALNGHLAQVQEFQEQISELVKATGDALSASKAGAAPSGSPLEGEGLAADVASPAYKISILAADAASSVHGISSLAADVAYAQETEEQQFQEVEDLSASTAQPDDVLARDELSFQMGREWEGGLRREERTEVDYATMLASLAGMLEDDFSMQRTILRELDLGTSSAHLHAYSTMWTLRPLVDERVVIEALTWL